MKFTIELLNNLQKKLFFENLVKTTNNKKAKISFFGHYHCPLKYKVVNIVGTFYKNYVLEFNKILLLADVHLGRYKYMEKQLKKLEELLKKNKKIIILGDFFDLWFIKPKKIEEKFGKILDILEKNENIIYIKGNHDWFIDKYFDLNTKEVYFDEKRKILFSHGHLQDPYFKFIGKIYLKYGEKLNLLNNFLREMGFLIGKIRKEEFF